MIILFYLFYFLFIYLLLLFFLWCVLPLNIAILSPLAVASGKAHTASFIKQKNYRLILILNTLNRISDGFIILYIRYSKKIELGNSGDRNWWLGLCQRPYHVEHTASRPISEVKQRWVWLVLGWVTAWEYQMLLAFLALRMSSFQHFSDTIFYHIIMKLSVYVAGEQMQPLKRM